ncbi:fluoride export protein 2 [Trichomonascus vanleenenianus]|uniref:FluC/FEX family fluoride channel n=1 Tax=Trichomonascus vanleenenianus TaxID=2268995 RepID=UPI003ECB3E5A
MAESELTILILGHAAMAFTGIVGSLARAGLTRLTTFDGEPFSGLVIWSNFAGCFILGMLFNSKPMFDSLIINNLYGRQYSAFGDIPIYTALATGFCGSLTSFSTFMLELFELSANILTPPNSWPDPGYGVMVWLNYCIATFSLSVAGFLSGRHVSRALERSEMTWELEHHERFIEWTMAFLGVAGWITTAVLAIVKPSFRYWCVTSAMAPFGVYARFWLARSLNKLYKNFFIGTFFANILATILVAIFMLLRRGIKNVDSSTIMPILSTQSQCHVVWALADGFCGSLSTISTFIAEIVNLRQVRYAYLYAVTSVFVGFSIVVVILGSYTWSRGLTVQVC